MVGQASAMAMTEPLPPTHTIVVMRGWTATRAALLLVLQCCHGRGTMGQAFLSHFGGNVEEGLENRPAPGAE